MLGAGEEERKGGKAIERKEGKEEGEREGGGREEGRRESGRRSDREKGRW